MLGTILRHVLPKSSDSDLIVDMACGVSEKLQKTLDTVDLRKHNEKARKKIKTARAVLRVANALGTPPRKKKAESRDDITDTTIIAKDKIGTQKKNKGRARPNLLRER